MENKFRKKQIVIEAVQWFKNGDHPEDESEWKDDNHPPYLSEGKIVRYYRTPDKDGRDLCSQCNHKFREHGWIDTLEGGHTVCVGDWIIKGVKGDFYPCNPDIFEATYEPIN